MNGTIKNKAQGSFPTAKLRSVVKTVVPKGKKFQIFVIDSKIAPMKIVRVVTPAWKSLRPADRITKVMQAANQQLTAREQNKILRFSVLTPDEVLKINPKKRTRVAVAS